MRCLFIYFKRKRCRRARLYFQKNPISKAATLPLIHCFQPLAAPASESTAAAPTPPPPRNTAQNSPVC